MEKKNPKWNFYLLIFFFFNFEEDKNLETKLKLRFVESISGMARRKDEALRFSFLLALAFLLHIACNCIAINYFYLFFAFDFQISRNEASSGTNWKEKYWKNAEKDMNWNEKAHTEN